MLFKIASYNIWFDKFLREHRVKSLISKISSENPCVVCLQEVVNVTHSTLAIALNDQYKYSYPKTLKNTYGCVIFSKYPIEKATSLKFKSNMGRQLDLVYIRLPSGKTIVVGNCHFESEFEEHNKFKLLQYRYTSAILRKIYCDNIGDKNFLGTFLCSDTNITQHDIQYYNKFFELFEDAWDNDFSKENTYDTKTNILLSESNKQIQARLDRILYLNTNKFKKISFEILKGEHLIEISDHYGVMATFQEKN